jgi:hypothetical protein
LKCCLLNYYPHVLKCWFVELTPTCYEVSVCWTLSGVSGGCLIQLSALSLI